MRKRNTIVLSSDDEDGKAFSLDLISTHSKSKPPKTSSVPPRPRSRRTKKARLADSTVSQSCRKPNKFDEIKLICEDFDGGFVGLRASTGLRKSNCENLWVDKYKPRSLEELSVQKKKVEEVKIWFEERLRKQKDEFCNNVLVISGPTGVGKSATVHTIASHLGATLWEWNTPTPTIWQEHLHNSVSGIRYTSKLDEFENFVLRIRKYGLISSSFTGGLRRPIILLIDDLPVVNGKPAYQRLSRCLHLLVQSASIPTAILITDCVKDDSSDNSTPNWEELQLSLQKAGACKVSFNPITVNNTKKTLSRLCKQEYCSVDAEQIDLIAKASGGDIRHAITSLQYFCVKPHLGLSSSFSSSNPTYSNGKSVETSPLDDGFSLSFGRDETLSLFHALGKFLHNKRETECSTSFDQDSFLVKESFSRLPMKMDAPEKVLCKAHGQARPIADFLHENVLDFIDEDAIDDACVVSSYLSDADFLLASLSGGARTRNFEAENVVQSSAASVAVRGVLFGNFRPLSSRWHAIRRPNLWQVEQSLRRNKLQIASQRAACDSLNMCDLSIVATEFKPALKWIGFRDFQVPEARHKSTNNAMLDDDDESFNTSGLEEEEEEEDKESTDDEIEDW